MRRALWILGLFAILLGIGCSDQAESSAPADKLDYELFPSTLVLDEAALGALKSSGDDGELVFDPEPAVLAGAEPGRVLLAGQSSTTPSGLLRVVTAVNRQGTELRLSTSNAPISRRARWTSVTTRDRRCPSCRSPPVEIPRSSSSPRRCSTATRT
jgi:hypothetical protein